MTADNYASVVGPQGEIHRSNGHDADLKDASVSVNDIGENESNKATKLTQSNGTLSATGYKIRETPMGTRRPLKLIFMGMGASGINFAYHAEKKLQDVEVVFYEKNDDIGGTWFQNRHPGCACDIPSVCYQYSWQRKPDWSRYYSGSKEIYEYLKDVVQSNNLEMFAKFGHRVVRAEWLDDAGKWKVTIMKNDNPNDTFDDYPEG